MVKIYQKGKCKQLDKDIKLEKIPNSIMAKTSECSILQKIGESFIVTEYMESVEDAPTIFWCKIMDSFTSFIMSFMR